MYENGAQILPEGVQTLSTTASDENGEEPQYDHPPNHYAVPYGHEKMWRGLHRVEDEEGDNLPDVDVRTALASSRHNSHYFSNRDLFAETGYHHLHYAKHSELVKEARSASQSLRVHHLSYALDSRTRFDRLCLRLPNRVPVLREVSFTLRSGDILAVLYTNDYEMRTLLGLMAGSQEEKGKVRGEILINGHKQRAAQLQQRTTYVKEKTDLPDGLTVLQWLTLHLGYKPAPRGRSPKLNEVLSCLALFPLRYRKCSSLSRTELARLNLASQILRDTDVVICENLLKTMDVYDTAFTIDFLRSWALKNGRIVVLAVQPSSSEMLHMFSKVLLLASGKITYFGDSEGMVPYFESIQFPCPLYRNPCDYYVDLATHDHLSEDASRESLRRISCLSTEWSQREQKPSPPMISQQAPVAPTCGVLKGLLLLYKTLWLTTLQKPSTLLKEILLTLAISAFLCLLFPSFPENRRSTAEDRLGLVSSLLFFSLLPLQSFWVAKDHDLKKQLRLGKGSGYYRSISFLTVVVLFNGPVALLCSLLMYLPVFMLTEFTVTEADLLHMISFLLPLTLYCNLVRQMTFFMTFVFRERQNSLYGTYIASTVLYLFSGLPFSVDDQPSIFDILLFISPSYWTSETLLQQQFLNYSLVSILLDQAHHPTELLIGCERKQVLAHRIGDVPLFGVAHCAKFKGSQLMHFFGYQSTPLSLTSLVVSFAILSTWTAIFFALSCCAALTVRRGGNKKD